MAPQVITANRLTDGDVVYLTASEDWSEWLKDAAVAESGDDTDRLLAIADQAIEDRKIVGPYEFEVTRDGADIRPISVREIIRAAGPSVRTDLGKQAAER